MLTLGLVVGAMTFSKTLITFIIVLGVLIFVHELGHYMIAKWVGVRVEEFALGFGPQLIGFKKGETQYSLRVFPLGGFCKMTGEFPHAEEELEGEELESYRETVAQGRALYQKSVLERFGVLFMGPAMNFFLALLLFFTIFGIAGVPNAASHEPVIGGLVPKGAADQAGLKVNDRILTINGKPVNQWEDISRYINESKSEKIFMAVEHQDQRKVLELTPQTEQDTGRRVIGVVPQVVYQKVGIGTALWSATQETWALLKAIVVGFWQMLTRQVPAEVGGPVMIAKMVGEAAEVGWVYLLRLTAIISVNLGIINLVPFPALDGGRILFLGIELVRGKPVDPEKEGIVHFIGFVLLMALIVLILYKDIVSIF